MPDWLIYHTSDWLLNSTSDWSNLSTSMYFCIWILFRYNNLFVIGQFQSDWCYNKVDHNGKLTHFIMNHYELLTLIQSYHSIFTFLVNRGLIAASWTCHCGHAMVLREITNSQDGYHWECPVQRCRQQHSVRPGSFFEDSKIPLVDLRVQQESISANWIIASHGRMGDWGWQGVMSYYGIKLNWLLLAV